MGFGSTGGVQYDGPPQGGVQYDGQSQGGYNPSSSYGMSGFASGGAMEGIGGRTGGSGQGPGGGAGGNAGLKKNIDYWMKVLGKGGNSSSKGGSSGADIEVPDPYEMPEKWDPGSATVPEGKIDPMSVINAAKPKVMEEMQRGFAEAARRQGGTGALMRDRKSVV